MECSFTGNAQVYFNFFYIANADRTYEDGVISIGGIGPGYDERDPIPQYQRGFYFDGDDVIKI
jgi:hypothetical protein